MRKIVIFMLLVNIFGVFPVQGKEFRQQQPAANGMIFQLSPQYLPHTGDGEFDSLLIEVNREAGGRIEKYINDICTAFHVPRSKVFSLIFTERMQPADVFMVFQTARLSGRPHEEVIHHFKQHRRKGWGAVFLSSGIRPRSRQFFLLIEDVPSIIWNYAVTWKEKKTWDKGSKRKGSKKKAPKGSKKKKGSKGGR